MRSTYLFFLAALMSLAVTAQAVSSRFTDGPVAGFLAGGDTEDPSLQLGWNIGYDFDPSVCLQFGYAFHSDKVAPSGFPTNSKMDINWHTFSLTGRWYPWHDDLNGIFISGGTQWMLPRDDTSGKGFSANIQNDFGLHAGLGVERSLTKNWEVYAEYRHVWHDTDATYTRAIPDGLGNLFNSKSTQTLSYNYDTIRIGLNYRF